MKHRQITIGSRVRLLEDVEMNYCIYIKGHEFTIIGSDNIRGFDLEDDDGNKLYETRFVKIELVDRRLKIEKIISKL